MGIYNSKAFFKGLEINVVISLMTINQMRVVFNTHEYNGAVNLIVNNAVKFV